MIARKLPLALASAVLAISAMMAGCTQPPRGSETRVETPPPDLPEDESGRVPASEGYELESEGEFPPPDSDVVFEEDQLPPAPEDVRSTPIDAEGAVGESVGQRGEPIEPIPPSVSIPVERSVEEGVAPRDPEVGQRGFRVQLVASADRIDAERAAREARTRLGVSVYVDFEAPYYKVRAGDFTDRGQAHLLRERARRNGYTGAWVVTTEIRVESADSAP